MSSAGEELPQGFADRLLIRDLVENWAIWRDTGDWARLRSCWHAEGRMVATWFEGSADEFVALCRGGFERGVMAQHVLGATAAEVVGTRAVAQTRMTIHQRAAVHGVECDAACLGRFVDLLEKREGVWGILLRQPVYEKDWLSPVAPDAQLSLDPALLARFPAGYRHLGYLQTAEGRQVRTDLPGFSGPAADALRARCADWLARRDGTVP
ncbi:nuclear transport factor 2 family protein [Roseomonas sp. BN140053]|uniref:nuclear transport factor 2 family protein n=1 Tax=Roseomonas sp. BN140053 TaxID=3391898 RepID=UPI0039E7996A